MAIERMVIKAPKPPKAMPMIVPCVGRFVEAGTEDDDRAGFAVEVVCVARLGTLEFVDDSEYVDDGADNTEVVESDDAKDAEDVEDIDADACRLNP